MMNLNDYVGVAERLQEARDAIQSIISEPPVMLTDAMGYIRVTVMLRDERVSTGIASFRLDLQGKSAQATNPLEDCETSAVGRALGMLGYGSKRSIASREEVSEADRRASYTAGTTDKPAIRNPDHPASEQQIKAIYGSAKGANIPMADVDACLADYDPLTKAQASAIIDLIKTEGRLPPSPHAPPQPVMTLKDARDRFIAKFGPWDEHFTIPEPRTVGGYIAAARELASRPPEQQALTDEDAIEPAIAPQRNGAAGVGR